MNKKSKQVKKIIKRVEECEMLIKDINRGDEKCSGSTLPFQYACASATTCRRIIDSNDLVIKDGQRFPQVLYLLIVECELSSMWLNIAFHGLSHILSDDKRKECDEIMESIHPLLPPRFSQITSVIHKWVVESMYIEDISILSDLSKYPCPKPADGIITGVLEGKAAYRNVLINAVRKRLTPDTSTVFISMMAEESLDNVFSNITVDTMLSSPYIFIIMLELKLSEALLLYAEDSASVDDIYSEMRKVYGFEDAEKPELDYSKMVSVEFDDSGNIR